MIKQRNIVMILILFVITLGIYGLYWFYSTANELIQRNKQDENPFIWLIMALIPIVNLFAIWKHAQAVELMTEKRVNGMVLFLLWVVIIPVAIIVTQMELNKLAGQATANSVEAPATSEESAPSSEEAPASSEEPPNTSGESSTGNQG